jgi:hypothetical protein
MKKIFLVIAILFFGVSVFAQTIVDVTPGNGTLNAAVKANQSKVVTFRLQANQWYGLTGVIEIDTATTIIGTEPASGEMPAQIQAGDQTSGAVFDHMFQLLGDFTLKNVFIVNADGNNNIGTEIIQSSATHSIRVVFDSVVCDPVGTAQIIGFNSTPNPKLFITNSLFLRHGLMNGANDNHMIAISGAATNGMDTLYLENNTFLCSGTNIYINGNFNTGIDNVIWMNHNSFILHKSQLAWTYHTTNFFVANNLFFDFMTQPWNQKWNAYYPDGDPKGYMGLVCSDTLDNEVLPSSRKFFVEYNTFYVDPRIQAYPTTWAASHTVSNDGKTALDKAYLMPLAYPKDSAAVNREAGMWGSSNFPNFKFANYIQQIDPKFSENGIYKMQDSLVAWTLPAAELNTWSFTSNSVDPQPSNAGNWMYCADADYNYGTPITWPRVNCSYTNSELLTASIEKLPLGDLNWFPTAKATWASNQAKAAQWITAENESQLSLTAVENNGKNLPASFSLSQNYPNPFNPSTVITYNVPKESQITLKVFNVLGQEVTTLVNSNQKAGTYNIMFNASKLSSGIYFYSLKANGFTSTKKMMLVK